jgi:hypothetical protein
MNASLNVGVGVIVLVTAAVTNGLVGSGVPVRIAAEVVGIPPSGVGVAYCPHKDVVLPPQAASKKEVVIKKLISLFTKLSVDKNDYTCV